MTFGILVLFAIFFAIAALGFPIGVAMLASGVAYLFATGQDVGLCVGQVMNGMQGNYVLLAIPLFILNHRRTAIHEVKKQYEISGKAALWRKG